MGENNTILYIDNDESFGVKFVEQLIKNRFEVVWTKKYNEISFKYDYFNPNTIICDIHADEKNILSLLEKFKANNKCLYIIIVTNNFEQKNLLKCMDLGISNYIEKNNLSFSKVLELLDKRRKKTLLVNKQILGDGYTYHIDTKQMYDKNGTLVPLNNQERLLIEVLLKNKNSFVAYSQIQNVIGKNKEVTIDSLRTIVRHIRKKTYNDIIGNLSGYGYKINLFSGELFYKTELNDENKVKNKKILIMEDSIELSTSLKSELNSLKLDCDTAFTFNEAKEKIQESDYAYILLDLHLPDKDGIDLLNSIQELTDSKIIVLTVDSDVHLKEYLYLQGILDYVEKNNSTHYLAYTLYKTILNIEYNDTLNNILVIDSSKIVCEHIDNLLKPRGYNLSYIYELKNGLSLLKEQKYDLAIIDLDILGENSFETLNQIKNLYKELPIILLSSNKKSSTNRDAFKNGVSEILDKPILAEEFILKVDFWIDYHRKVFQLKGQQQLLSEYKHIVDKASIVSKTNEDGIITYVNNTFCKISGYSEDELLGRSHNLVRHDEMTEEIFEELWDCIKNKKQIWHGKIKNRRKDGTPYYVDSYIMPILDVKGDITEYIALRNFITEKEFYN